MLRIREPAKLRHRRDAGANLTIRAGLIAAVLALLGASGFRGAHASSGITVSLSTTLFSQAANSQETTVEPTVAEFERQYLSQVLYRARSQPAVLRRGLRELAADRVVEGLQCIQQILDAPDDGFDWNNSENRPQSIRQQALIILRSQKPSVLNTYEQLYGRQAQEMFAEAQRARDASKIAEVARRFALTRAGFLAQNWQASMWLDTGCYELAARTWSVLLDHPSQRQQADAQLLRKLEAATALARDRAGAFTAKSGELVQTAAATSSVTRKVVQADFDREQLPVRSRIRGAQLDDDATGSDQVAIESSIAPRDWRMVQGNPRRNASVNATTPFRTPLWVHPFESTQESEIDRWFQKWEERQQLQAEPMAVANSAIVVDRAIVVRDFDGLRALDPMTGTTLWTHRCETSLTAVVDDSRDRARQSGQHAAHIESLVNLHYAYTGNSTLGMLSSDGERVYAVDSIDLSYRTPSQHRAVQAGVPEQSAPQSYNRLVAVNAANPAEAPGTERPIAWELGGMAGTQNRNARLTGNFFLGPPLPADGRLFALSESERQLNLFALNPQTGDPIWTQAIGFVELPIELDMTRYPLASSLCYADGILVCPTHLGVIVAADGATGTLLWATWCGDIEEARGFGRWPHSAQRTFGYAGLPDVPQIADGSIVCLPHGSTAAHCVDLYSGTRRWSVPRDDAMYIGTVSQGVVVLVGMRRCRGLSLENGKELWSTRLDLPSGRGLATGNAYLVPLQEGRVATLNIVNGQEIGVTRSGQLRSLPPGRSSFGHFNPLRPGNLLAYGNSIVSCGAREVAAFPQSKTLLRDIELSLNSAAAQKTDRLLAAELRLTLGDLQSAKRHLNTTPNTGLSTWDAERSKLLMREVLYQELQRGEGEELAILDELEPLTQGTSARGKYLLSLAEVQLQRHDLKGVTRTLSALAALDGTTRLQSLNDSAHIGSPASWAAHLAEQLPEYFGTPELNRARDEHQQLHARAVQQRDEATLERLLNETRDAKSLDRLRSELGRLNLDEGRFHAAELYLLAAREANDVQTSQQAAALLAELWDRAGLYQDAAKVIDSLSKPDAAAIKSRIPPESLTWTALEQRQLPQWRTGRVQISEERWIGTQPELETAYSGYRRKLMTPRGNVFDLLDKGSGARSTMAVIDTQSGLLTANIEVPSPNQYPPASRSAHVGHFIPMGSTEGIHGVTLLADDTAGPAWSTVPAETMPQDDDFDSRHGIPLQSIAKFQGTSLDYASLIEELVDNRRDWLQPPQAPSLRGESVRVGPAGPTFCSFQTRQQLVVADPISGQILWQRDDLEANGGLLGNSSSGLFGDDQVLVYFSSDKSNYVTYRTRTGKVLSRGSLGIHARHQPHAFGRKLFYLCDVEGERRMRIWDPAANRIEFDAPATGRVFSEVISDEELAVIVQARTDDTSQETEPGRLRIFHIPTAKVRVDLELNAGDLAHVNYIRTFRDQDRYYINFQRSVQQQPSQRGNFHATSSFVSTEDLQGDLFAIDCQTGRRLWTRSLPQRSLIQTPQFRLPFLVAISSVRDNWNHQRKGLLVEVFDAQTGDTIGLKEDILADRIVQVSYDPDAARVRLHGLQTTINIDFGRNVQGLAAFAESANGTTN